MVRGLGGQSVGELGRVGDDGTLVLAQATMEVVPQCEWATDVEDRHGIPGEWQGVAQVVAGPREQETPDAGNPGVVHGLAGSRQVSDEMKGVVEVVGESKGSLVPVA
jgi:hypothetical protein